MKPLAAVTLATVLWPGLGTAQSSAGQITHSFPPAYVVQAPAGKDLPPTQVEAEHNTPFRLNDELRTEGDGRLRAQLNDGSILTLGSKAALKVIQHDERTQQSSFELHYGWMRAQVVRLTRPDSSFEIRANTAVCSVLGQADLIVDARNLVDTVVVAFSGTVVVTGDQRSVKLTSGQSTTVTAGQPPSPPQPATLTAPSAPAGGSVVGGGVFRVGGGVSAPQLISRVEPKYPEAAREDKCEGTVVIYVVVDVDGTVRDTRMIRSLGCGLDEMALEAVSQWKFNPGMKDGRPVAVAASIEVVFRLPGK